MERLVTGIKATGSIHLGNLIGAVLPVVALQDTFESFMFVADLHALNQVTNAAELRESAHTIVKAYLAAGLSPEKVTIFRQSSVPGHSQLATVLAPSASHGMLERAHAYKDAIAKGNAVHMGLFNYPVLMAADILLYKPTTVPVGADQQQHLEMTREIAGRFNATYGETFPLPQARLMGGSDHLLKGLDGRKMSKSYGNEIGVFDDAETIRAKVAKIVTDSARPEEPKDPEADTIFSIYRHIASETDVAGLAERYRSGGLSYREAKDILAEAVITFLAPIQARKAELDAEPQTIHDILTRGAARANEVAAATIADVYQKTGLSE